MPHDTTIFQDGTNKGKYMLIRSSGGIPLRLRDVSMLSLRSYPHVHPISNRLAYTNPKAYVVLQFRLVHR